MTAADCNHCGAVCDPERLDRTGLCARCLRGLGLAPTERPPAHAYADCNAQGAAVGLSVDPHPWGPLLCGEFR